MLPLCGAALLVRAAGRRHRRRLETLARESGELERQLRHQAAHDALTGLPNRRLFAERLGRAASAATATGAPAPAVIFLDIDDFKAINDRLGHAAGDEALAAIGRRLARAVGEGLAARLGGDEFAVLLERPHDRATVVEAARRLLDAVTEPLTLGGRQVPLSATVGVAAGEPHAGAATLMQKADVALHRAKSDERGRYRLYEPALHAAARERSVLEDELRAALEREQFVLHYQPLFDVSSGELVGCEALVRWAHPERGLVSPARFIPVAEETRLVVPIGQWVAREACRQAGEWQRRYPGAALKTSINLSFVQAEEIALVDEIDAALRVARLDAERLVVEITEGVMMKDLPETTLTLYALKRLGVEIVVDDFGTGYSSLSYLNRLPLDGLKIPKPFVDGIDVRERDYSLTHGIVALARALGLRTVAEGVERESQLARVAEMGCESVQGYLLGRPGDASAIDAILSGRRLEPVAAPPQRVRTPLA